MSRLARFRIAQDQQSAGFDVALSELETGRKRGHWIWYVFPQLAGLGRSDARADATALKALRKPAEYLRDPVLRDRLLAVTRTVEAQVRQGNALEQLMGSPIDVLKLVSSLTLFGHLARTLDDAAFRTLADSADAILAVARNEGYPPCESHSCLPRANPELTTHDD